LGLIRPPDSGRIVIGDSPVFDGKLLVDARTFRRRHLGFVFQKANLIPFLTARENVQLAMEINDASSREAGKRAMELLEQLGLQDRARHKPYQLSGGERQRVAIGRALMNEPRLLLADEPTGNLDSTTGNGILNVLERLHKAGQTIVMVTHDERVARRAQRVITLADGKVKT
jgi:putative ABC transport system ATP-binding protein